MGLSAWTGVVRADTADATCEVRKDGDRQQGKSGPCTVSQRQGYIDIDLRNGDKINLSPGNNANHYKDQNGNKVVRRSAGTAGMSFKWESGKHVNVTWVRGSSHNNSYGYGGNKSGYARGGNGGVNRLDNGDFEIVLSKPFCSVQFNSGGRLDHTSPDCTDSQVEQARDAARCER